MSDHSRLRAILDAIPEIRDNLGLPEEPMTSLPVPVEFRGAAAIAVFLFPWSGLPPGNPRVYPPIARMVLSPEGRLLEGGATTPADFGLRVAADAPLGEHDFQPPLSSDQFHELESALCGALDRLMEMGLFWNEAPNDAARIDARIFHDAFERISQRPLRACYRALNPSFFVWLDAAVTASPDAPNPGDPPR